MSCPPAASILLSADQATAGDVCEGHCLAVAQSSVNVLTLSGLFTGNQCCNDTNARIQTCGEVCYGNANLHRRSISGAGDVHQAKLGLNHDIVSSSLGVRPRLSITRD